MPEFCEELCGMGELLNAIVMQLYFCYIYLFKNKWKALNTLFNSAE